MYHGPEAETFIREFVVQALYEDVRDGDHTSLACIPEDQVSEAFLLVKQDGMLAGVEAARQILELCDPELEFKRFKQDGDAVRSGEIAFEVRGNTRALLQAERLVLNTLQRMSGIATQTRIYRDAVSDFPVQLLDTRKTTPLFRFFEKWAVFIGGGSNYRYGLFDRFMIKDNHIQASGGIAPAIRKVLEYKRIQGLDLETTVEVKNLEELRIVQECGGIERVMFDNFSPELLRAGVEQCKRQFETEASGGIQLANIRAYAASGVDFISIGALTHSAKVLDLSLKIR